MLGISDITFSQTTFSSSEINRSGTPEQPELDSDPRKHIKEAAMRADFRDIPINAHSHELPKQENSMKTDRENKAEQLQPSAMPGTASANNR